LHLAQVGDISTLRIWVTFQLWVYTTKVLVDSAEALRYCPTKVLGDDPECRAARVNR
jgi:hypothetical protein